MANTKSAQKRTRQTIRRTARNKSVLKTMRSAIKGARAAKTTKGADATAATKLAISQIMRASSKGVIKKGTASRYVSRLAKSN